MTRPSVLAVAAVDAAARRSPVRVRVARRADASPVLTVASAVDRWARWLMIVVAADLLITRFVVRLAIFVPKGEPWATMSSWIGRLGAMVDALVPILGVLLLATMLVRAGRQGWLIRTLLVAATVVAGSGFMQLVWSPTPAVAIATDLFVVLIVVGVIVALVRRPESAGLGTVASLALAGSVAASAFARLLDTAPVALGTGADPTSGAIGTWISAAGQVAFVAGAVLLGLVGLAGLRPRQALVRALAFGVAVAAFVAVAAWRAAASVGQLTIFSVGLTGVVPAVVIGAAVGLAIPGLIALHRRAPEAAIGGAIVLLAGYGLAASGLLLASLLGLLYAGPSRQIVHGRPT